MVEQELKQEYLDVASVQANQQDALMAKSNVVGCGVAHKIKDGSDTGDISLTVFVTSKMPKELLEKEDMIPKTIQNIKTDVVETGYIFAGGHTMEETATAVQEEFGTLALRNRSRPVEGGYSVGHYKITAGTYATAVYDSTPYPGVPRKYYVLSNNHVLANSNDAKIGDPILQPGPYDGGTYPADMIAKLSRYVPIKFDGSCNYVDAAIAEGPFHYLDREIFWIGYVKGIASVRVGTLVQKTGRTTNYTNGRVIAVNATVKVNYGGGNVAKMCRQIVTTNMSAGGDSGSLLCDLNENAVGLLFAGSSSVTIHNDIRYVQHFLGIRVV